MTHRCHFLKRGIVVLVFVAASITSFTASAGTLVYVADVEHLYTAVNDDTNAGVTVVLAPGVYLLSELDPPALAGTNNHALVQLRGISALVGVVAVDSEPPDPSGTNTVTVVRIP